MKPLIDHLLMHSVRTDGPFVLRSGATSSWYLDARQTTFSGDGAALVGQAVLSVLDDRVTAVGGMTMGADPIALATALAAHQRGRALRSFSVRKEAKDHGVGGRLVGPVSGDDVVAVLEDTSTTGGALSEAVDVLTAAGIEIAQAVVLVDRSQGAAARLMSDRGIPFVAVLQPSDLGMDLEME
ncbi:MAG TPA: orotate phosphoribosyltransferase [Acidimicrobiia bacterium]|jgi:orotate phosphoribosyltransferase